MEENVFEQLRKINPGLYNLYEDCVRLIVTKNHDYTAGDADFYKNFNDSEDIGVPGWISVYIRLKDKLNRIRTFIKNGALKVKDESFIDTCKDIANYFLIMADMWRIAKNKTNYLSSDTNKIIFRYIENDKWIVINSKDIKVSYYQFRYQGLDYIVPYGIADPIKYIEENYLTTKNPIEFKGVLNGQTTIG